MNPRSKSFLKSRRPSKSIAKSRKRDRLLRYENFELRLLLAVDALIGIDFDTSSNSPAGFVTMSGARDTTFANITNIHGEETPIDVAINLPSYSSFRIASGPLTASQIPSNDPALNAIGSFYNFESATSTGPFEILVSDLNPGQNYDVYLVAISRVDIVADQSVSIIGANTVSFNQSLSPTQLFVNDELGSSSRTLGSFSELITADANGQILVSITTTTSLSVGGFAIQPANATTPTPGTVTGRVYDDVNKDQALGLIEPGLVGQTVYLDLNSNGQLDNGEPTSLTAGDNPATTTIDESGSYSFSGLTTGTYQVRLIAPPNVEVTSPQSGFTSVTLSAAAGKVAHLGTQPFAGVIQGFVWHDRNGNGIFHDGEIRVGGRTVYLDTNDNGTLDLGEPWQVSAFDNPLTTVDETGSYRFDTLPSGTYAVRQIINPGDISTAPVSVNDVFNLQINFGAGLTESQREIFYDAAAKWESIIVGNLPAFGNVDDIVINASALPIDGPSGILGSAGPTNLRPGSFLPAGGNMTFDTADIASLEASGGLGIVILHEMGHTLGFTSGVWSSLGLVSGLGGSAPKFNGPAAIAEFNSLFGLTATSVPVENDGGSGTAGSHWEESVFDEELMTGFYDGGRPNPLSRVTVGAFQDMGYIVDSDGAEAFDAQAGSPNVSDLPPSKRVAIDGRFITTEPDSVIYVGDELATQESQLKLVTSEVDVYRVTLKPGESIYQIRFGVNSVAADFGDAPDSFGTTFAKNGARHAATGPQLGPSRDVDIDGAPSTNAQGDGADDDGVSFGIITASQTTASLSVDLQNASSAKIDAWIDFNHDGDWSDPGEQILADRNVNGGLQTLDYAVPSGATAGQSFARVRVSTAGGLASTGPAADGEVEDYAITILPADNTPPLVTAIIAGSSAWLGPFIDAVDGGGSAAGNGLGYALVPGQTIANIGVDRIYVQFSEPVNHFNAANVVLFGANVLDYASIASVSYDATNNRGVISLTSPLMNDKLRLGISGLVTDAVGNSLSGGTLDFRFNVLVGDASDDGNVNGGDLSAFAGSFNNSAGQLNYNSRADWNSDGQVNGADLTFFAGQFNASLPASNPPPLNFGPGALSSRRLAAPPVDKFFSNFDDDRLTLLDVTL